MINKKAQGGLGITIIVSFTFFIIGLLFLNFFTPEVVNTRAADQLNCSNATGISDGNKLLCLAVDLVLPYFILLIFSTAGGYMSARLIV
jgi:hypothetical protein